jgi:hypothetical protein
MDRRTFMEALASGIAGIAGIALVPADALGQRRGPPPGRRRGRGRRPMWSLLGEKRVSFRAERDVIRVGRREGRFSRIGLEAIGNDVHLMNVTIHFGNRTSTRLRLDELVRAGRRSRVLDFPGNHRIIHSVELTYRSTGRGGRRDPGRHATVRLYGIS